MRLVLAVLLLASSLAADAKESAGPLQKRLDPTQFDQLVALVRQEMVPGGRYGLLEPNEKTSVEADLARMERLLDGHERIEELPTDEQVDLLNTQERVNALLTKRDRDRLICEHKKTLGTHRKQVACQTYGELVMRKQEARDKGIKLMEREQLCRELTSGGVMNSGGGGLDCR